MFLYGTEKKDWIAWAVKTFHDTRPTLPGGRRVVIEPRGVGSAK